MPVRAVLDTNVWVSALLNPAGAPARILEEFITGNLDVVISAPLIEELAEVLGRPRIRRKYGVTNRDVETLLTLIEERAEAVSTTGAVSVCRDPDDDAAVETAINGGATHIVSRDEDLTFDPVVAAFLANHEVAVVTVAKFLTLLATQNPRSA